MNNKINIYGSLFTNQNMIHTNEYEYGSLFISENMMDYKPLDFPIEKYIKEIKYNISEEYGFTSTVFNTVSSYIMRNFDIMKECYLKIPNDCRINGNSTISVMIGGEIFDKFDMTYLKIYNKLTNQIEEPNLITIKTFFNKYDENFLPLRSLTYHEVRILIDNIFVEKNEVVFITDGFIISNETWKNRLLNPYYKLIEQVKMHKEYLNYYTEDIHINETYNILNQNKSHKVFKITNLLDHIFSFLWQKERTLTTKIRIKHYFNNIKEIWWCATTHNEIVNIINYSSLFSDDKIYKGDSLIFSKLNQKKFYKNYVENVHIFSFVPNPNEFKQLNFDEIYNGENINELELDITYNRYKKYEINLYAHKYNFAMYNNGLCALKNK